MGIKLRDEERGDPQRDQRGRFKRGSSGNPDGRPRKWPEPPKSLARCFAERLAMEVAVNDNGTAKVMSYREALVESVCRALPKAKLKEMLQILERLEHLSAGATDEQAPEELYTEEDRRILEKLQRDYVQDMCCRCERPTRESVTGHSTRGDFQFD